MNVDEFKAALDFLGWSQAELARRLGLHYNSVSKWVSSGNIPDYVAEYLRVMTGLHHLLRGRK